MTPTEVVDEVDAWIQDGGKFPKFGDHNFTTVEEAKAVVRALANEDVNGQKSVLGTLHLFDVVACFQGDYCDEANEVLRAEALPVLRKILSAALDANPEADFGRDQTHFFAFKNLAYYAQAEDIPLIVRMISTPRFSKDSMWPQVFDYVGRYDAVAVQLLEALRDSRPTNFSRIAYLDFANDLAFANKISEHPFDAPSAVAWMEELFENEDEGYDSFAVSATKSASFLADEHRQRILARADAHPRVQLREEAQWARARGPEKEHHERLIEWCHDPRNSTRAVRYLEALGEEARIPECVTDPSHLAVAKLSDWLSEEQDFWGQPPDTIAVVDHRTLNWVPAGTEREFRLIRFACDQSDGQERGYDGIAAVWGDFQFENLGQDSATLAAAYAELLSLDSSCPDVGKPVDLLMKLNPDLQDKVLG